MIFKRLISALLVIGMTISPIYPSAQTKNTNDSLANAGREAQSFGKSLSETVRGRDSSNNNGTLNLNGSSVNINDLYPSTSSSNARPQNYYFPGGAAPSINDLGGVYNDSNNMDKVGSTTDKSLYKDSLSDNPSISGAAYKILLNASNRSRPDFSNDPMLNQSKDTFNNIDEITKSFGDCSSTSEVIKKNSKKHIPEYERCERIVKPAGACKITHTMGIEHQVADVFVAGLGRTWLTVEFDLKNGTGHTLDPTDGIAFSMNIPTVKFEDVCTGANNYKTDLVGSWDWIEHGLGGTVDSTVHYRVLEFPTCDNNLIGKVQIQDTSTSSDTKFVLGGKFSLRLIKQKPDVWASDSCIADAQSIGQNFCTGNISVDVGPPSDQECVDIGGVRICPGDSFFNSLTPSPIKGLPTLTQSASVSEIQCNFNVGQMDCWTDPQGVQHCPHNAGTNQNSCGKYENNNKCGFVSTSCLDGAKDENGKCYVFEDTYDCGHDVDVIDYTKNTQYSCSGSIKCMGSECLDISSEQNGDFAKAAALLNAAQFIAQDMQCSDSAGEEGGDGNVDEGCKVFSGTPGQCKIAVGGIQNCCEKPENISLADYITMLMAMPKLDSAIMNLESGSVVRGSYQVLRDPVVSGWQEVTKPFASFAENIGGSVDAFTAPIKEVYNQIIDSVKSTIQDVIKNSIQNGMTSAGAEAGVAAGTASELSQQAATDAANMMAQVGNIASTVMTVYTVYVVSMMMIQLIWACEKEEFELNAKRSLKSCHYVGSYCKTKVLGACIEKRESYCCYNSPLSRIMNEQIRGQMNLGFGTAKAPSCDGLKIEDIGKVDWDQINLDEWLGILGETGHYPTPETLTMDKLTGSGNILNDGNRVNSVERAKNRLEGVNVDEKRKEAERKINSGH